MLSWQAPQGVSLTSVRKFLESIDGFVKGYNPRTVPLGGEEGKLHFVRAQSCCADLRYESLGV